MAKTICKQNNTNNAAFKDAHECDVGRWEVKWLNCIKFPPIILCMEKNNHCYENSAIMFPVIKSNKCLFQKIQEIQSMERKQKSFMFHHAEIITINVFVYILIDLFFKKVF